MPAAPTRPLVLLFDLDGTLVDSIALLLAAFRHAFRAVRGEVPPDHEWLAGIGTPLVTQFRGFTRDEAEVEALVAEYRSFQREHHDALTREFEGARETLSLLRARGHPMALVTSKMVQLAERALDFAGLRESMDLVVGADSCGRHKPDPEPVLVALAGLGAAPVDALFVGDSPHDILAGNAAGVATVAALWGPFDPAVLAAARPTHAIGRITDLPGLVERVDRARDGERRASA